MLATNLGDLVQLDPKKMQEEADKTNKNVEMIFLYMRKIYTDIYKNQTVAITSDDKTKS